jgi:hypothetical protein
MKKIVLLVAMAVTAANLTLGITYAAVCQDSKGARFCGSTCQTAGSGGGCSCSGGCSDSEMNWVGGGKAGAEELEEVYDYSIDFQGRAG